MAPDIRLATGACAALAAAGGAASGLWLGILASGLPPDLFLVCSTCVLLGAAWLTVGVGGMPPRAGLAAAAALGGAWSGVAWFGDRPVEALLCAVMTAATLGVGAAMPASPSHRVAR